MQVLGKYIKLDGVVTGPLGRDTNRYASNGTLRIAYELQGSMHRRRPWLVLIQGMGFDRCGAVSGSSWWTTGAPGAAAGRRARSR
jgi:hypothetical protein